MSGIRKAIGSTALGCALCLGVVVPTTLSATVATGSATAATDQAQTQQTIDQLIANGVFRDHGTAAPDDPRSGDWLTNHSVNSSAILVVTPGTDDGTLYKRIQELRAGRHTLIIDYPESLAPIVSGRSGALLPFFAPGYDTSRDVAVARNLAVMRAFAAQGSDRPLVVYTGYSQGAEAVGNAAEAAVAANSGGAAGIDTQNSRILLVSDPRSPWGLKAWAADHLLVGAAMELFGAESNGARNPSATGPDLPVTSVIVVGDPVSNFQWVWYRPVSSLIVDGAGFLVIHSGMGKENYGTLGAYDDPAVMHSVDGNTTYLVYKTKHHPLTMLSMLVKDSVGIPYDADDLARLDRINNAFYPLQEPTPGSAAVPVAAGSRSVPTSGVTAPSPAGVESAATPTTPAVTPTTPTTPTPTPTTESQPVQTGATGTDDPSTTGRHRAPESATPSESTTTPAPAEPTDETDDTGTGGRHRLEGGGRHSADNAPQAGDADAGSSTPTVPGSGGALDQDPGQAPAA